MSEETLRDGIAKLAEKYRRLAKTDKDAASWAETHDYPVVAEANEETAGLFGEMAQDLENLLAAEEAGKEDQ